MSWLDQVKWDAQGLVPVIAQEQGTGDVLMFAWMNRESLALTAKGHDTVAMINAWATRRVVEALGHLDEPQQRTVASGLAAYAQALAQRHVAGRRRP